MPANTEKPDAGRSRPSLSASYQIHPARSHANPPSAVAAR
jgi:hypothetical protein